jgi:hypothetical protein
MNRELSMSRALDRLPSLLEDDEAAVHDFESLRWPADRLACFHCGGFGHMRPLAEVAGPALVLLRGLVLLGGSRGHPSVSGDTRRGCGEPQQRRRPAAARGTWGLIAFGSWSSCRRRFSFSVYALSVSF